MASGLITLLDRIEAQGGGDLIEDFGSAIPVKLIGKLRDVYPQRRP